MTFTPATEAQQASDATPHTCFGHVIGHLIDQGDLSSALSVAFAKPEVSGPNTPGVNFRTLGINNLERQFPDLGPVLCGMLTPRKGTKRNEKGGGDQNSIVVAQ